jgi:hypothetical protein
MAVAVGMAVPVAGGVVAVGTLVGNEVGGRLVVEGMALVTIGVAAGVGCAAQATVPSAMALSNKQRRQLWD